MPLGCLAYAIKVAGKHFLVLREILSKQRAKFEFLLEKVDEQNETTSEVVGEKQPWITLSLCKIEFIM